MEKQTNTITGSTIKIIAMVAMLIDHVGATLVGRIAASRGLPSLYWDDLMLFFQQETGISLVFIVTRLIGRIAFPIFCFLLVEGFFYTKNKYKYAFRLLLFAIISEVPFDLSINAVAFETGYQNVYFTLFLGLCALIALEKIKDVFSKNKVLRVLIMIICGAAFTYASDLLRTDYAIVGVLTIIVMYLDRRSRLYQFANGCLVLTAYNIMEVTSFCALPLIKRYNGKRGINLKYVFYAFYPAHLLILYIISYFMGLADAIKGYI